MRSITLEILRHGPSHNQLLSPLTRYLVLCGNREAETLELPFEHAEYMLRLKGLDYRSDESTRQLQFQATAKEITTLLGSIRSFIAALSQANNGEGTHLRLILSANELALLPFEMANVPGGLFGSGQPLVLQMQAPVCITREVRRTSTPQVEWTRQPKILFVSASPNGVEPVPVEAHALALRTVVEPLVQYYTQNVPRSKEEAVGDWLRFLPEASIEDIEDAFAQEDYTHVHILAHGIRMLKGDDRRFGLALHQYRDKAGLQVADGERLAVALASGAKYPRRGHLPTVVTLAACQSGDTGSVIGAGASIAHALHEARIPLVIASQFPLTFDGSVVMTETLYQDLLFGCDPREALSHARAELYTRSPKTHDWASLVAYTSLPDDVDGQVLSLGIRQMQRTIDAAFAKADYYLVCDAKDQAQLQSSLKIIGQRMVAMGRLLEQCGEERRKEKARIHGLLGSAEKRRAEVVLALFGPIETVRKHLETSLQHYEFCVGADPGNSWGTIQTLPLRVLLSSPFQLDRDDWLFSTLLAERERKRAKGKALYWAYGNLIELHLLGVSFGMDGASMDQAESYARSLVKESGGDSFEVFSTWRQMRRYDSFFYVCARQFEPHGPPTFDRLKTDGLKLMGILNPRSLLGLSRTGKSFDDPD